MTRKIISLLLLSVILVLPLLDLIKIGLPMTHDGIDHVARIANFYQNLTEGNSIPRWAPNLNWGYGHPILMFLYPFPSYLASLFHYFGSSFVDSTKLVFAVTYILSGIAMYIWLQAFLGRKAAIVGALAYCFAPYRFVDLYVRGALGEHAAFIFPPLIFYALFCLTTRKRNVAVLIGSLSVAGLLLSHNAVSLMFLPLIVLYLLYLSLTHKKRLEIVIWGFLILLEGLILSAFFWLPAFFEGKYTLRDIVTKGEYAKRFETWDRFFFSDWGYGGTVSK